MVDILKMYQDAAIKYPKHGTNTGAYELADGTQKVAEEIGCHAYMSGWMSSNTMGKGVDYTPEGHYQYDAKGNVKMKDRAPPVAYYTSLWAHEYTDEVLEYFRFLCNKQYSPWREHIKGSEVLWGKKDGKDIPVAIKLTDMNASPQAVLNFMLACRMAYAQPGLITCYGKLRKAGFTRTESTFLSASFGLNKASALNWPYIGDYPYDTAFADMSWDAWKTGKPRVKPNNTLLHGGSTKPINAIWNEEADKKSGIVVSRGMKNNRICDLVSEEREITNIFGKKEKRRFPLDFDAAVKKLKDNEEVWKCQPPAKSESTSPAATQPGKIPLSSTSFWHDEDILSYASLTSGTTQLYSLAGTSASLPSSTGSYQSVNSPGSTW